MRDARITLYKISAGVLAASCFVLCALACSFVLYRTIERDARESIYNSGLFITSWNNAIDQLISGYQVLDFSLAILPVFTSPPDYADYRRRFQLLTAREAQLIPSDLQ